MQNKFIGYLEQLKSELKTIQEKSKVFPYDDFSLETKIEAIKETKLIVPIIGAFSSGKSSLINSFLGDNYLPVNITPETALATELHYSDNEYIEAVKKDATFQRYELSQIDEITKNADQFKFMRLFIINENLKKIEPLVLVDMPGFESPLDLHNQAIMEYINKGVHYIVLTSVEDGTITRSMERQLTDIQEFGRGFSFFLSKTNLRATNEAKEVAIKLQEQIEEYFDIEKEVVMINDNGGESLKKILLSIDPEKLFEDIYKEQLINIYYEITDTLNTTISSLSKDKQKNQDMINELKKSFAKIQKERDQMVEDAYERYSNTNVNKIVESVGKELSDSIDELVNVTSTGGQDAMGHLISEIARHSLVTNIKGSMSDISNSIVDDFALNLQSLNDSMSDFTMSDNWLEKIADTTKNMLGNARGGLDDIIKNRQKNNNNDKIYKAITSILAITTTVLAPAVELIIVFLPEILGGLLENYQKQKQQEQIKNVILTQIIPSLKRELRTKLPEIFNKQVQEMIQSISSQFEQTIEEKKETIEATQKEIDSKNINIEEEINLYTQINKNITELTNNTLYR